MNDGVEQGGLPNRIGSCGELRQTLIASALDICRRAGLSEVLLCADDLGDAADVWEALSRMNGVRFVVATRRPTASPAPGHAAVRDVIAVPDIALSRMGRIKIAVLVGLSTGVLRRGDRLVCLSGAADSGELDTLMVMQVGKEFELFAPDMEIDLGRRVNVEVFNEVLKLAVTLFNEGREGKPIGTMFVIGDPVELLPYTRQMVLNPFRGYDKHERRIFDLNVQETLKEFSLIDGAFLISNEGLIEAAGAYLNPPFSPADMPRGWGTRHHVAAGITGCTSAIALAVSESSGTVTVFHQGRIFIEIEAPRRAPRARTSPEATLLSPL